MGTDVRFIITNPRRARQGALREVFWPTREPDRRHGAPGPGPRLLAVFRAARLGCLPVPASIIATEGPSQEGNLYMGMPEVIVTACWEMNLKGTDHFAGYREFAGLRLHNGRVFADASGGKEARAPDVVTLVSDASEDRFNADHSALALGRRAETAPVAANPACSWCAEYSCQFCLAILQRVPHRHIERGIPSVHRLAFGIHPVCWASGVQTSMVSPRELPKPSAKSFTAAQGKRGELCAATAPCSRREVRWGDDRTLANCARGGRTKTRR